MNRMLFIFMLAISFGLASQIPKDYASKDSLRILSWNVFLRPKILKDQQLKRVRHIAFTIKKLDADMVLLQEVFHKRAREILIDSLKHIYPYNARNNRKSVFGYSSGLITFSKQKIDKSTSLYFSKSSGSDCLAKKGGLLVDIQTGKQHISVLNTHLQAGSKPKKQRVRMHQVEEISKLCMNRNQLMVFAGDFNIRFESIFFHRLKQKLHVTNKNPILKSAIKHTANFSDQELFPVQGLPVRIDHIMIKSSKEDIHLNYLEIKEPRHNDKRLSDHNPIIGVIQLN